MNFNKETRNRTESCDGREGHYPLAFSGFMCTKTHWHMCTQHTLWTNRAGTS